MPKTEPRLLSVQVGKPRTMDWKGAEWTSAIYKNAVEGRLFLDKTNLTGDRQANTKFHGGPTKAVCCFPVEHYPFWRETLGRGEDFAYGAFGENFTLEGLTEQNVCIGDVYRIGSATVQVCQPRIPCINLARKWSSPEMPKRMMVLGHSGFYLRVLETGEVGVGDMLALLERPHPQATVAVLNAAYFDEPGDAELERELAKLPELAPEAKRILRRRLAKQGGGQS